jgi:tRNA U38,U39,U40 pseudouridine synthase TruA
LIILQKDFKRSIYTLWHKDDYLISANQVFQHLEVRSKFYFRSYQLHLNSGTSRPTSAVAGTVWLDTTNATNPTLKFYDGADDISLAQFDFSANTVNWLDSTVATDLINDVTPQLGGQLDVNGFSLGDGTLELLKFIETASAVNELTITNSATGNAPEIIFYRR